MHTYIHHIIYTYIHLYIHTYIHTYITLHHITYTYIHLYIHTYMHIELIFCVEFMYNKSSSCLDHKNMGNGNFGIIYLGLIEAVFINYSFCDAAHFIHEAGFALL